MILIILKQTYLDPTLGLQNRRYCWLICIVGGRVLIDYTSLSQSFLALSINIHKF